jgi:hypothetical protein
MATSMCPKRSNMSTPTSTTTDNTPTCMIKRRLANTAIDTVTQL